MSKNMLSVLNENDVETITTLIDKLEASPFNYLKLENQDLKIVIGKNGVTETVQTSGQPNVQASVQTPVQTPAAIEQVVSEARLEAAPALEVPEQETEDAEAKQAANTEENTVTINAATTGIFYAQPEPGADPYVKVGDTVQEDSTVGLIEIMKVYSAISAGVAGVITEIHVESDDLVEVGQPLISVKVN
ncbi:acetyl-CoA carboxylase biotin carboxyl carrier protein [Neobacillus vireti]|uniref:acetyl-CoA carboxylase biotin carboxyl carrier protein n=1 Tax=Neobacillus vireti TaxID=220686 RepID=UPI002FFFD873